MNCIKAYRAMYLKVLMEVTNAQRPSFIIDGTQLIESWLHVNGDATEASSLDNDTPTKGGIYVPLGPPTPLTDASWSEFDSVLGPTGSGGWIPELKHVSMHHNHLHHHHNKLSHYLLRTDQPNLPCHLVSFEQKLPLSPKLLVLIGVFR